MTKVELKPKARRASAALLTPGPFLLGIFQHLEGVFQSQTLAVNVMPGLAVTFAYHVNRVECFCIPCWYTTPINSTIIASTLLLVNRILDREPVGARCYGCAAVIMSIGTGTDFLTIWPLGVHDFLVAVAITVCSVGSY